MRLNKQKTMFHNITNFLNLIVKDKSEKTKTQNDALIVLRIPNSRYNGGVIQETVLDAVSNLN